MVTISDKVEEGDQLPPAYTSTDTGSSVLSQDAPPLVASSSSSPSSLPPLSPPTNFLTISRTNQSIKGTYSIDPSLPKPPGSVPSTGPDGKLLNLSLNSQNGSIDAVIELVRSGDSKGPARFETSSKNGSVTVLVHDKRLNRFRLLATSANGSISLHLPSTYEGTVSTMLKNGKLTFSAAVQARLTTFSEQGNEGRFFIGDYAHSGYENDETWMGDHLRVEANNGRVKIDYADDSSVTSGEGKGQSGGKGFFGRLLG